jgi:hypothetical protein
MPINRKHYPPNWEAIALNIKTEANWTCEQCHRPCLKPGETLQDYSQRLRSLFPDRSWVSLTVLWAVKEYPQRFRLTVAHLDQDPGNNQRSNLKALCSVCHLGHDRPFRQHNRYRKRERDGQLPLKLENLR